MQENWGHQRIAKKNRLALVDKYLGNFSQLPHYLSINSLIISLYNSIVDLVRILLERDSHPQEYTTLPSRSDPSFLTPVFPLLKIK